LGGSFGKFCSLIGYSGTPDGCGSGSYSLALNFVAGSVYANGNPLDFYSVISLSASANAGPPDLGYAPGTMTAFIDPQITFGPGINLNDYSLSVGGVGTALVGAPSNGVPEPAAWAMMLVGFGGIGAMMRRRRPRAALA
ncbi:MAG TPA: PEPxxWA-CTERM sorting domain-containing protein, partial [Phenylobacterium sp.]|nr:PEPxxWA-CTERM sorting domain-containing protein [Phenylobacterium sp.]